ncbi:cellular communication network factor 1, like 2 [Hypomesus transpacificus]|uniref:cellular communication network factor 1, like 2 n=1 Tax=Hypomesus transpacificus TaxID=137520 RepID=UPI001F0761DA|nr:cellular communication network factor 1, like 2 [Hypomesus transpacificus]
MYSLVSLRRIVSTLFVVLSSATVMVESDCSARCSCPTLPPSCPPGVSWVADQCGCCKVCAKQFNEDCGASQPCDHIKGLHCHLGAGGDPERGLCRADAQGRPCEFSGRVFQHGEDFQPSCQHQCSCMDGVVGCMPLCPHQVPLPDWRCARPRLARPSGRCCEEWVCDDDNHISEEPGEPPRTTLPHPRPLPNHISTQLQAQALPHEQASAGVTFREGLSLPKSEVLLSPRCRLQTTDWTECSTTCGMGISSRVTNNNPECRLVRETRLCQIRQCELQLELTLGLKRAKKCQRTVRPQEPIRITFAGCSTARRYRPRSCGACTDGRCCAPSLTRTARLRFLCPDGEGFTRNVMWIQRCSCRKSCQGHGAPSRPGVSLHNDIHTFRH